MSILLLALLLTIGPSACTVAPSSNWEALNIRPSLINTKKSYLPGITAKEERDSSQKLFKKAEKRFQDSEYA
ncbi:MAG: hypothetical protein ACE5GM_08105, partial [bacterium]